MKKISLNLLFIFFVNLLFSQNDTTNISSGRFATYSWDNKVFPIDTLISYNNDTLILSETANTIFVINFWSTYCPPCLSEMKQLNTLKQKYSSYQVKFIAISSEPKADIEATLKNHPFNFLHYTIKQQLLYSKKIINGFPTNLILDQDRVVKFHKFGGSIAKDPESGITSILSKEIEKLNPTNKTH